MAIRLLKKHITLDLPFASSRYKRTGDVEIIMPCGDRQNQEARRLD